MGDVAESMINGDVCQVCGQFIGEGEGYPRTCGSRECRKADRSRGAKMVDERLVAAVFGPAYPRPWKMIQGTKKHEQAIFLKSRLGFVAKVYGHDGQPIVTHSRILHAAPEMLDCLRFVALQDGGGCRADPLNPCFANRPEDVLGQHWGGGKPCATCWAKSVVAVVDGYFRGRVEE